MRPSSIILSFGHKDGIDLVGQEISIAQSTENSTSTVFSSSYNNQLIFENI